MSDTLYTDAQAVLRKAGDIAKSYFGKEHTYTGKDDQTYVTEADLAVEEYLLSALGKLTPEASFITEEAGKVGPEKNSHKWVIDPLDGTTNFAHDFPYF